MAADASRWGIAREVAAAAVIVAVGIGWRLLTGSLEADATPPPQATPPAAAGAKPVAVVNGVEIAAATGRASWRHSSIAGSSSRPAGSRASP
jgi:hypothetical protein